MSFKKSKKSFLLLEILIALFLVSLCILPLAHLPMKSMEEAVQGAWRLEAQRLADMSYAEFREDIYSHQIKEDLILKSLQSPVLIKEKAIPSSFPLLGKKIFQVKSTLSSKGKKDKQGDQYFLLTYAVTFHERSKLFRWKNQKRNFSTYTYKVLVCKHSDQISFS